jgi:hypothetical protein
VQAVLEKVGEDEGGGVFDVELISFALCRNGFPGILKKSMQVAESFKRLGPEADIDINNVMMRFTMDVTGLVGFAKDYQTCVNIYDAKTDDFFEVLRTGVLPPPIIARPPDMYAHAPNGSWYAVIFQSAYQDLLCICC